MLRNFPLLSFMVTHGFMHIIHVRWLLPSFEETREMGFGQITLLFLLVHPIFAAAESYYGKVLGPAIFKLSYILSNR
jgi:hypothetical protein